MTPPNSLRNLEWHKNRHSHSHRPTRLTALTRRRQAAIPIAFAFSVLAGALSGCSLTGGTLGGRDKCWSANDARAAALWRGILRIDASGGRLNTPEGDVIVLLPGALATHVSDTGVGEVIHGREVIARDGDNVTLFGGIGADGTMVVCGLEEIHAPKRTT